MNFWNLFTDKKNDTECSSVLHSKIKKLLPHASDEKQIKLACIAGLFVRVAFGDMKIHPNEITNIKKSLTQWTDLSEEEIDSVTTLAIDHGKNLAGLENHKYCSPLNDLLSDKQKYELLVSLFQLAASDGRVEEIEGQEISFICHGLLLEQKHYLSAKASVVDFLEALKKE